MAKKKIGKYLKRKLHLVAKYYIEAAKAKVKSDQTYSSGEFSDSMVRQWTKVQNHPLWVTQGYLKSL